MPIVAHGGTSNGLGEVLLDRQQPAREGLAWLHGPVEDILRSRSSVRAFSADPLPASCVRDAVSAARAAEAAVWPARSHGAATFEVLVAAFNVAGLDGGLYPAHGRCPLATPASGWLDSLRGLYADAPALLLICGDLNGACRAAGPSGYGSMLVRAGSIGYGAWLWAVSASLAASVYGGTSHRVTGAARLLNGNLRHLFTVAIGAPMRSGAA